MTEESSGGTQPTRTPPDNNNDDELLSQFLAFSGSSDETKAASYLEMCGNDVETAVSLFLEHEQHQHQHQQHQQQGGLSGGASSLGDSRGGGDIRAPDETRTMRLMDDDDHGNSGGGGGMLYRGGRIPGIGGGDPAAFHLMNAMMDMEEQMSTFAAVPPMLNSRAILDAAIAAQGQGVVLSSQEGKEDYENGATEANNTNVENNEEYEALPPRHHAEPSGLTDMFAPPHHIIHRAGGFQGARTMAKDTKRWLLVNIQRDAEFSSHALNRDVWRDELVENLIREGFIFWQTTDDSVEGRTYTERYKVMDYPHIAIIDPRTGRLLWRREGWTQQNPVTSEFFAEMAMDFCSRNSFDRAPQPPRPPNTGIASSEASLPAKRQMTELSEDEQMKAAMKASMEAIDVDDDENENEFLDDSDDDDDDNVKVVDSKALGEAKKEPTFNDELQLFAVSEEPNDGSRIQLRTPCGKKAIRKFSGSDPVRAIYAYFAQTNEETRSGREFSLMAGYPPHSLIDDIDTTIDEANLKGEAITVQWK